MKRSSAKGSVSTNNKISQELNRRPRGPRPSVALVQAWHKEFIENGAQFRQSFYSYKKWKLHLWRVERRRKSKEKLKKT